MKYLTRAILFLFLSLNVLGQINLNPDLLKIDRKAVVERHRIVSSSTIPNSPAQVGNGEFAFGMDITGLQTFVQFNTMSHWSWHSLPLPKGKSVKEFKGLMLDTHGRMVQYDIPNAEQPELSAWLAENPHRYNLGRIGFCLLKSDGTFAKAEDLKNTHQEIEMWTGIISSYFELEGRQVKVKTACHPREDAIGVSVKSDLIKTGQIKIFLYFPYPNPGGEDTTKGNAQSSKIERKNSNSAVIARQLDDAKYFVFLNWTSPGHFVSDDTSSSPQWFYLNPENTDSIGFTCCFSQEKRTKELLSPVQVFKESSMGWSEFWESGAAIDLSQSKDPRWEELERRIVLSQYLMRVNEAGIYPPQESGLVNNGWYGRFHFEMIWWHSVHYALWNRWPLFERSLHVYKDYLSTSKERAKKQGYKGARWPKCTANSDRDWPHPIHALLIWQ